MGMWKIATVSSAYHIKLKHIGEGKRKKGNWEVPLFSFVTRNSKGLQLFGHNKIQTALY